MEYTPIIESKNLTSTLTEVFLDPNLLAPAYSVDGIVSVYGANDELIYSGLISPTTTSFSVTQSGIGFRVGQVFNIAYVNGVGTLVKISNVTSSGGINDLTFINYGYNFSNTTSTFSLDLNPVTNLAVTTSDVRFSRTQGFTESGSLTVFDPSDPNRYFYSDYTSNTYSSSSANVVLFSETSYNAVVGTEKDPSIGIINFFTGALSVYPGSFSTNKGFVSEPDIRIQDDKLYQPFAYQTNTDIDYSVFFDVVKKLIHPAGQRLFNNRTISSSIDITSNISVLPTSNVNFEAVDSFQLIDEATVLLQKQISDSQSLLDNVTVSLTRVFEEVVRPDDRIVLQSNPQFNDSAINAGDQHVLSFEKQEVDAINITDSVQILAPSDYSASDYFAEEYVGFRTITA